jgi:hypothetical protein
VGLPFPRCFSVAFLDLGGLVQCCLAGVQYESKDSEVPGRRDEALGEKSSQDRKISLDYFWSSVYCRFLAQTNCKIAT